MKNQNAINFITMLVAMKENSRVMAHLKDGVSETTRFKMYEAIPMAGETVGNRSYEIVASLYAIHPRHQNGGNFGNTCKKLSEKYSSVSKKFSSLLEKESVDSMGDILFSIVKMAKANGISIDYSQLLTDILFWDHQTKIEWARMFYQKST